MTKKYTFSTFKEALDFLEKQRGEGYQGIYFPEGGDNPRRWVTDTARHIVLIMTAPGWEPIKEVT